MWAMYMSFITPIITALVLAMAAVPAGSGFTKKIFFYGLSIPALYGLTILWFNIAPNALDGYLFFTCFIVIFYFYLLVKRAIKWLICRRKAME